MQMNAKPSVTRGGRGTRFSGGEGTAFGVHGSLRLVPKRITLPRRDDKGS